MPPDWNPASVGQIQGLLRLFIPQELGKEYVDLVALELEAKLAHPATNPPLSLVEMILAKWKHWFANQGRSQDWATFYLTLEQLVIETSENYVTRFVMLLDEITSTVLMDLPNVRVVSSTSTSTNLMPKPTRGDGNNHNNHTATFGVNSTTGNRIFSTTNSQKSVLSTLERPNSYMNQQSLTHFPPYKSGQGQGQGQVRGQSSPYTPHNTASNPDYLFKENLPLDTSNVTTLFDLMEPYYESLPEGDILTYIPFTLVGLDLKHFTFKLSKEKHQLVSLPNDLLNHSYVSFMHQLLEPALLYKQLTIAVEEELEKKGSKLSPIRSAFYRFLQSQLNNYVSLVNSLFNEQPQLLLQVYQGIAPQVLILRTLYTIQITTLTSELVSKIKSLLEFGYTLIKLLANTALAQVLQPFFEILEHWLIKGELIDNSTEFFISFKEAQQFNDIIELNSLRLYGLLSPEIGELAYHVGKLLIFLHKYCQEIQWYNSYVSRWTNIIFQRYLGLQLMSKTVLYQTIKQQYREVVNFFSSILFGKYETFKHLVNFKKYLLMESNDFIEALFEKGSEILDEPSSSLTLGQLSLVLTDAINALSVNREELKNRLDARLLDLSSGNIGWEVFTVEYKIGNLALEPALQKSIVGYFKMFNFLWKLRNINFLLNKGSRNIGTLYKTELKVVRKRVNRLKNLILKDPKYFLTTKDNHNIWIIQSIKCITVIQHRMATFFTRIIEYLLYEIVETSFKEIIEKSIYGVSSQQFQIGGNSFSKIYDPILEPKKKFMLKLNQKITTGSNYKLVENYTNEFNMDQFMGLHEHYLESIVKCKLLDENVIGKRSREPFIDQIYEMLDLAFAFVKSAEEFESLTSKYYALMHLDENSNAEQYNPEEFDDDILEIEQTMRGMMNRIKNVIYTQEFEPRIETMAKDMTSTLEFRELGRLLG